MALNTIATHHLRSRKAQATFTNLERTSPTASPSCAWPHPRLPKQRPIPFTSSTRYRDIEVHLCRSDTVAPPWLCTVAAAGVVSGMPMGSKTFLQRDAHHTLPQQQSPAEEYMGGSRDGCIPVISLLHVC